MVAPQIFGAWMDGSGSRLRKILGELEGVSEETLERIDFVSRPTKDGPRIQDPESVLLYDRLVLLALSEAALAQQKRAAQGKARK